ncbi:EAL domain-containing protein [Sulfurimonas sp.]|nr:EAL domain-containing protein [Sulfurimonas sp.]
MNEKDVVRKVLDLETTEEIPITSKQYNQILEIQQTILEMLSADKQIIDALNRLCNLAESLLPNSVASIMIKSEKDALLNVLAAPSIPEIGHNALACLKPGPGGGSCGNAVFKNEPQYVQDTFQDDRWSELRHIAYDFNLCSCWSMPVKDKNGEAIGSFALSSFEHRTPSLFHKKLLETAASIVSIALNKKDTENRIKLFYSAMQNATEPMLITNHYNNIIEVNSAFEKCYGVKAEDLLGKNPSTVSSGKHNKEFYENMWNEINANSHWTGEIINKHTNGTEVTQWMSISSTNNSVGDDEHNYLAIFSDLTELKQSQEKVEYMAYHDTLTKLYNKTHLEYILKEDKEHCLMMMNINNFSYINTNYGFSVGDKLLIKLAELLNYKFGNDNIYRINSDEFAILYDINVNIEKNIAQIKNYFYNTSLDIDGVSIKVTFCYGASYGNENILRNTSIALKQAKRNGKNHSYIYNPETDSINDDHRAAFIESNATLYKALEQDNIVPYFQGIRDNKTGEITKFEVLARIEQDEKIISPYYFLEPAELSGLLPEITKTIIDKSFKIMSKNDYTFSINITEDDLSRNYLKHLLAKKVKEYNIDPKRVILEILEGVSASGKNNQTEQLNILKERGFSIAIDDFGTEYSNFERILDLEIDYLKIDAKYIKDIHKNKKSYEIAKAIAFFAKNAGIPCIAEFVHTEEVQDIILELEIDYSQGFYFSEPSSKPINI